MKSGLSAKPDSSLCILTIKSNISRSKPDSYQVAERMTHRDRLEIIVTDKRRSYRAATKVIGNEARQETGRWLRFARRLSSLDIALP